MPKDSFVIEAMEENSVLKQVVPKLIPHQSTVTHFNGNPVTTYATTRAELEHSFANKMAFTMSFFYGTPEELGNQRGEERLSEPEERLPEPEVIDLS